MSKAIKDSSKETQPEEIEKNKNLNKKEDEIDMEKASKSDNKKSAPSKKNEKLKEEDEKKEKIQKSIRRLGNFLLTVIVTLIVGTGALVYYLSYTNNVNISASDLFQNSTSNSNTTNETSDEDSVALGNIIDSAVSSVTNNTTVSTTNTVDTVDAGSRKVLNENMIVLYNGLLLDTSKMDKVELKYIDNSSTDKDKYEITYYSYEKFKLVDSGLGTLSSQIYDGLIKIENVGKVAISEDYDAVPRSVKVVNSIPTIVSDNNPKLSN
jgi:hypothetical protein